MPLYFNDIIPYYKCSLIPPAWTLSLELAFYIVAPALVIFRRWGIALPVVAVSLWVYGQSYLGLIDTDHNAFRHLPGTIFMSIAGVAFAEDAKVWRVFRWSVWAGAVLLMLNLLRSPELYALNSNKEILLGLVVGIPALALTKRLASSRLDRLAGDLSYGVFLNHFLVVLMMRHADINLGGTQNRIILVTLSIILSLVSFYAIEKLVLKLRHAVRRRSYAKWATKSVAGARAF